MIVNDPSTKVVVLSPAQAHALLKLLDRALSQVGDEDQKLGEVHQRLSDAVSLSQWLRENVALELHAVEIVDLAEALVVMLDQHSWSDRECEALQAVVDRLSSAASMPPMVNSALERPNVATVASHCK